MEQSLETLFDKVETISKGMSVLQANVEEMKDKDPHKAQEEEKDEKKEAKKAKLAKKLAAVRKAMEKEYDEEKEAAIKKAMEDHDDEDTKKGQEEKPIDEKKDPEKKDHIASIIEDKRKEIANKILTANKILNPANIKEVEKRLFKANLTEVEREWQTIQPFVGSMPQTPVQEKVVPFFANYTPTSIDENQLNANSPDSEFSKISTKDLLSEMYQ